MELKSELDCFPGAPERWRLEPEWAKTPTWVNLYNLLLWSADIFSLFFCPTIWENLVTNLKSIAPHKLIGLNGFVLLCSAHRVQIETVICWDINIQRQRQKQRERDREGEGLAKHQHHACSLTAKSTHTDAATAKITLNCPHVHLHSSLPKSMLFPKQKGCQKRGQGSKSPLTGSMNNPGCLVACSHGWVCVWVWTEACDAKKKESPQTGREREKMIILTSPDRLNQ